MSTATKNRRRHFDLGGIFHRAAEEHPHLLIHLDHQLGCSAEVDGRLTVSTAALLVDTLTMRLQASRLVPRTKVVVWHRDGFDLPLLVSSVSRAGAVPAMLSPHLPVGTVVQLFEKLRASVIISDADGARALLPVLPEDTQIFVTYPVAGLVDFRDPTRPDDHGTHPAPEPPHVFEPSEPILITHTSGTTRLPKLAVHSGRSLWYRVFPQQMISLLLSRTTPALISVTLVHTRFFGALGMFFRRGKPFIVASNPDPESIAALLCEHRPDYVETHPNTFVDWEPLARDPRRPLASVKVFHAAFDAIHPRTMRILLDASDQPGARFFRFYGQSEVGPSTGQYYTRKTVRSSVGQVVGWPIPGLISVRTVDASGRRRRHGKVGHIWVASGSRTLGYHGDDEAYTSNVHGRWWDTGDMGSIDRRGRLRLADRQIDHVAGVASTLHYEDLLMDNLPAVREAIIIENDGSPTLLVSIDPGHELAEDEVRTAVATMPAIREVIVVDHDLFPMTATRKVQRPRLARLLADESTLSTKVITRIDV